MSSTPSVCLQRLCGDTLRQLIAELSALATNVGTDSAVFMHLSMSLTFTATTLTNSLACLEKRAQHIHVRIIRSGKNSGGRTANISAVEIEADAMCKLVDVFLCQTSIGTGSADGGTLVESLYCTCKLFT